MNFNSCYCITRQVLLDVSITRHFKSIVITRRLTFQCNGHFSTFPLLGIYNQWPLRYVSVIRPFLALPKPCTRGFYYWAFYGYRANAIAGRITIEWLTNSGVWRSDYGFIFGALPGPFGRCVEIYTTRAGLFLNWWPTVLLTGPVIPVGSHNWRR